MHYSFIATPTYKLAKFLLKIFTPSKANEYIVIHSFQIAAEICQQDSKLHMASPDIDSLSTNISLDQTIDICVDNLYNDSGNLPKIPKHGFRNLLNIATKESFFTFNNKYKQVDGAVIGSPLVQDCPNDLKRVFYRSYVDGIFPLRYFLLIAGKFEMHLSSKLLNIIFSIQKERNGCLPFFGFYIFAKFATNVYRKNDLQWGLYQLQKFYT